MTGKHLITTDAWFLAPDGRQYKAVWGDVTITGDEVLGIKTNARSANWFAKVGSPDKYIIVAGCQIHYAVRCEDRPNTGDADDYTVENGKAAIYTRPTNIYIAE